MRKLFICLAARLREVLRDKYRAYSMTFDEMESHVFCVTVTEYLGRPRSYLVRNLSTYVRFNHSAPGMVRPPTTFCDRARSQIIAVVVMAQHVFENHARDIRHSGGCGAVLTPRARAREREST